MTIKKNTLGKVKGKTTETYKVISKDVPCSFWGTKGGYNDTSLSVGTLLSSYTVMCAMGVEIKDGYLVELNDGCVNLGEFVVRNPVPHKTKFGIGKSNIEFIAMSRGG